MNGHSRREFIGGLAALTGLAGCKFFGVPTGSARLGTPDVRFGVVSDVHLNFTRPNDHATLEKTLRYFRDRGADAVMVAGDIADTGRISELQRFAETWYRVFPDDKAPDGRHVEKLFIYGNHDRWGAHGLLQANPEQAKKEALFSDEASYAKHWEEIFHEPYAPFWLKRVKGFTFAGGHWTTCDQFDGLEAFLKAHAAEIDPRKPFFYTQHSHPKDTCIGPWAWGRDNGASTRILSQYPNAVAFSGHSHYPLTDERTVWQGAFTSVNTASLRYCSVDYALRENIGGNAHGFRGEMRKHLMHQVGTGDSQHGMLVSVHAQTLVIERRDFAADRSLGDDWVLDVPCRTDNSFAARAKARSVPAFAPDARIAVADCGDLLTLTFPAAQTVGKSRVFEYEVTATLVEDDVDVVQAQRRVLAPDYYRPETPGGVPGSCLFSRAELKIMGHYVFTVRPLDCFGQKGAPISVEYNTWREPPKVS